MTSIKLKTDNDLSIEDNKLVLIEGIEEIAQILRQRLRVFKGDWFLDTSEGIPYYEEILKKNPSPVTVDSLFKNEILNTPGVVELLSFELIIEGRRLDLTFSARTEQGILNFNEEL